MPTRSAVPFRHLVTLVAAAIALHAMRVDAHASPRTIPHRVIEVRMIRDSSGQHYRPSVIRAEVGDTLRFVNGPGRHNVDFVADSAPAGAIVPAPTQVLEHDGDSVAIPVPREPGSYFFQCDPHVSMGMVGHLVVRPHNRRSVSPGRSAASHDDRRATHHQ